MGKVTTDPIRINFNPTKVLALAGVFAVLIMSLLGAGKALPVQAAAGVNQQINFQARLLNSQGATVPDGNYNIEFKIYQDGPGTLPLTTELLKWTETRLNNSSQGVVVKNGYFSVMLGSVNTALNSSVDFNQDTLWLSVNVANTNATCTPFSSCSPDGEMIPFKRLAANPYALNSGKLGGLTSAQYGQLATTQTFTGTNTFQPTSNISSAVVKQNSSGSFGQDVFSVQGSSSGNFIQVTSTAANAGAVTIQSLGGTNALNLDAAGALNVGPTNTTAINLGRTGLGVSIPATGVVAVSLTGVPAASATSSLIQLSAPLAGGSGNGTYVGANPSSFSGDFENYQVNGGTRFKLSSFGDVTSGFTTLNGVSTTNGAAIFASTSMTLASTTGFDIGNYIKLDNTGAACSGAVQICYAKITNVVGNVLTISPALIWATGKNVTEVHIPEVGGSDLTSTLTTRYGQGYFINGVTTGNGSTDYTDGAITSNVASFGLLNTTVTTLNIGGAASTISLGASGSTVSLPGNLSVTGTITGAGPATGTSGYLQRNTTTLSPATSGDSISTSGNISTTGSGVVTAAGGASISSGLNNNSGGVTNAGSITGVGTNITGTAGVTLAAGASSALNLTGAAPSTWDIGNNLLSLQTTGNGAITTGTGLLTTGGNQTFSGTTARTITGPTTGGLTVTVGSGPLTVRTTTSGTLAVTSAGALSLTGAASSTWDIGNNLLSLQTAGNGAITTGTGLLTQGGNVTFSGTAARVITGPSTGGLTTTVAAGPLTLSTTTSGTLSIASAGALSLTGNAPSTWDIGANTLSVQTTGNGAITTGTGLLTTGGNQTFSGSTARTITGPSTGGLGVTVASGPLSLSTTTSGALTLNSAGTLNFTGAAPSTWDIGANTLSLQTTSNGGLTTGSGLLTQGGNLTFSGTAARTITGPATGGLTMNVTAGPLTVSTTTSGALAVTSAGALNLTGGAASTFDIGNNTLSIQATGNGAITTGTGLVTLGGDLVGGNKISAPSTSGAGGQGFYIRNSTPNDLASFQALDLAGNTYGFFAVNKHYDASIGWVDDGLGRTGSSFQIQNDNFTFYSFDTGVNFTPRLSVASGGYVGVGTAAAAAQTTLHVGWSGTTYNTYTGIDGTTATLGGSFLEQTVTSNAFTNPYRGSVNKTIANFSSDPGAKSVLGGYNEVGIPSGNSTAQASLVLRANNNVVTHFGTGTLGTAAGLVTAIKNMTTGTITDAIALQAQIQNQSTGTITNSYGLQVSSLSNTSGTITNTYGVYVGDMSAGTQTNTPYSFYASDANALNFFAGSVNAAGGLVVGSATTDATNILLQLDSFSTYTDTASCSTTTNQGAVYYNTNTNAIRGCVNGGWEDVVTTSGLGILAFGVVTDSGTNSGDIESLATAGTSTGPCRPFRVDATHIGWTSCVAYSGGRKVVVAANLSPGLATSATGAVNTFQHLCLNGTDNQPTLSARGTETANLPSFNANNPILCLGDVKMATLNNATITQIYDTRVLSSSVKQFAYTAIAMSPGMLATASTNKITATGTTQAGSTLSGVVGVADGTTVGANGSPNAIIVVSGHAFVKATAGTAGQVLVNSTTAGYATSVASPGNIVSAIGGGAIAGTAAYIYGGFVQIPFTATCNTQTTCQGSVLVNYAVR